jgi:RES domain-containing protein
VNWLPVYEGRKEIGEEPVGYDAERMKPLRDRAIQGRVNPAGIPVLYLASTEQTAISEVRPWIGAQVSVAQFIITRSLKMLDLSEGHGQFAMGHLTIKQILKEEDVDPATITKAVWTDIDGAFSRPVSASDDTADYVPTQILAELFRGAGYDGLIYRSMFGEKGYNLALFDVDDAELINCAPYDVRRIVIEAEESGNRWFATGNLSKRKPARRRRRPGKSL